MIRLFVNDIRKSLENACYFSALSLALTLPDICGMAEYPNKDVGDRYISWCDSFLIPFMYGDSITNGLSGETIYNLRNTYLHQGSINIDQRKIKNENNIIDKFILVIGECKKAYEVTFSISIADENIHKEEMVFVDYLCTSISECAIAYYFDNKEKFSFDCHAIHVNNLFPESGKEDIVVKSQTDEEDLYEIENDPKLLESINGYTNSILPKIIKSVCSSTRK